MKKGFTLIELLAVIVILAIIALIAVPIVLNIINDSKESSVLRSAEFYLDGVELSITQALLKSKNLSNGNYNILESGNVCLEYDSNNKCIDELDIEVKGELPNSGSITITGGEVSAIELVYGGKTIVQNTDGKLMFVDAALKYRVGQEVKFNPGDGDRTWNVINEDAQTVTLMLTENLGKNVKWYEGESYSNYGPVTALKHLNELTLNWDNVDPIESYSYINNLNGTTVPNGYQKIEITNGITILTHKDGTTTKLNETNKVKARILTQEEVFEIAQKTNTNLTEENLRLFISENLGTVNALLQAQGMSVELTKVDEAIAFTSQTEGYEWLQYESKYYQTYATVLGMINMFRINPTHDISIPEYLYQNLQTDNNPSLPFGYWTLSSFNSDYSIAWCMYYDGTMNYHDIGIVSNYGVRPVITVSKSKL